MPLPNDRSISLEQLAQALAEYQPVAEQHYSLLRVVALSGPHGLAPFVRVLRVGVSLPDRHPTATTHRVGDLTLTENYISTRELGRSEGLKSFLDAWVHTAGGSADFNNIQGIFRCNRYPSASQWADAPSWVCSITYGVLAAPDVPRGPFFSAPLGFFASTVGDAAARWTQVDQYLEQTNISSNIDVVIPDHRGLIKTLARTDTAIVVEASVQTGIPHFVAATYRSVDGTRGAVQAQLNNNKAELPIPRVLRETEVFLLSSTGDYLDSYSENEHGRYFRYGLLQPPRREPPQALALRAAVDGGESEVVELKEWLPISREKSKSGELLKTASAFANTSGGTLFIGVSDDLEILGLERNLAALGTSAGTDPEARKAFYVQELRRLLNDGLTPSIAATFEWLDAAGHSVLKVHVPFEMAGPVVLVESSDGYVRRGANNKRLTSADLLDLVQARRRGA